MLSGLTTDFLDGYLARKWLVCSGFGAVLDAQLDRLLLLSAIIGMGLHGDIPAWVAGTFVVGFYLADIIAERFELLRIV